MYVYRVHVTDPLDCCPRKGGKFIIDVIGEISNNVYSCKTSTNYESLYKYVRCRPPILAQHIKLSVSGANTSLVVCHVAVFAFGELLFLLF